MATQSQLNQLQHSFSDINELIANAVIDQLVAGNSINREDQQPTQKREPGDVEGSGFSLQPIHSLLQQHQSQTDSDGEDSPPTDSLRSIKSIAEKKRRMMLLEKSSSSISSSKVRRDLSRVLGESGGGVGGNRRSSANIKSKSVAANRHKSLTNNSKSELARKRKL